MDNNSNVVEFNEFVNKNTQNNSTVNEQATADPYSFESNEDDIKATNNVGNNLFNAAGKAINISVEVISGTIIAISEMTRDIMQNQRRIRQGITAALLIYIGAASIGKTDALPHSFAADMMSEIGATANAIPVLNDVTDYGAELINSAENGQVLEKIRDDTKDVPVLNRVTDYLLDTTNRAAEYRNGPTAESSEAILRGQSELNQVNLTNGQIEQAHSFESSVQEYNDSQRSR